MSPELKPPPGWQTYTSQTRKKHECMEHCTQASITSTEACPINPSRLLIPGPLLCPPVFILEPDQRWSSLRQWHWALQDKEVWDEYGKSLWCFEAWMMASSTASPRCLQPRTSVTQHFQGSLASLWLSALQRVFTGHRVQCKLPSEGVQEPTCLLLWSVDYFKGRYPGHSK